MSRIVPILFNTNMVRAILDGRKTVTRRLVKYEYSNTVMEIFKTQYGLQLLEICEYDDEEAYIIPDGKRPKPQPYIKEFIYIFKRPPYKPGDILYVRETWNEWDGGYIYKAWDEPFPQPGYYPGMTWHPSIHMPKEAARIWLKVTDIKVERLQDITESGAIKEGFESDIEYALGNPAVYYFSKLWDKTINKKDIDLYSWKANPWVWVIEFKRCVEPKE